MASQLAVKNAWAPRCVGPWARVTLYGGARVLVDPLIVEAVKALNQIAAHYNYRASGYDNAGYGCRRVAGTGSWSKHSYGIAIDREWTRNPHRYPLTTDRPMAMNRAINRVRTKNGRQVWSWGGYWRKPDAMHDEIVCFPQDLASGINWATVEGGGGRPAPQPQPAPKPPIPIDPEEGEVRLIRCAVPGAPQFGEVWAVTSNWERIPVRGDHYARWQRWIKWWYQRDVDQVTDLGDWMYLIWTTKPRQGPNGGAGGYP